MVRFPVNLFAVAAIFLAGQSFAAKPVPAPPPPLPLAFYDAGGQLVGRVAIPGNIDAAGTILLPWATDYVPILISNFFAPDGYKREAWFKGYGQVFFSGPSCTGTGYVYDFNNPPVVTGLPRRLTAVINNVLYVSIADTPPASISWQSWAVDGLGCQGGSSGSIPAVMLDGTLNLGAQFVRPLVLK